MLHLSPMPRVVQRLPVLTSVALLWFLTALPVTRALGQSGTEIIRGRVFGPDSLPIGQADVLVTGLATQSAQTTRTDTRGVYTVLFANPEGEYVVAVRKIGYVSSVFRLSRTGVSSVMGLDVYLKSGIRQLDTIAVSAGRTAVIAEKPPAIGESGSGTLADALFLADPSKLMDLILSLPGIYATDSGFSVMGAASDQNRVTLDGANFRGGDLPPDAVSSMRVITSSADPAQGGFAGATTASTLKGGTDIFTATVRGTNSNRTLTWADPEWSQPIPRLIATSGTMSGPIKKGVARYNVSWSGTDRGTDWFSLLDPRAPLLAQQGIVLDTVVALTSALTRLGIPLSQSNIPRTVESRSASTTEVFDFTPTATTSIRFSHGGNWSSGVSGVTTISAFPTRATHSSFSSQFLSLRVSGYVHGLLNELSSSVDLYHNRQNPYSQLPSASVRVGTNFDDGHTGFASLAFGGGSGASSDDEVSGTTQDELSWLPKNGAHKLKVGGSIDFDHDRSFSFAGPLLGSYTYLSMADLLNNQPASYDRVLVTTPQPNRGNQYGVWVGDEWTASKALQLQGGLRFDFADPITKPVYNPVADSVFGIRTDRIPNDVGISPRLGFSWSSKARRGQGSPSGASSLGGLSAATLASLPPELVMSLIGVQRSSTLPGIGVSGSLGAYRGVTSISTIGDFVQATGVGTRVTLSCVGAAVPTPNWATLTAGPTACADGTFGAPSTFSIERP